MNDDFDPEAAVRARYSEAAAAREEALCCDVTYPKHTLDVIPREVLDRDYGCGDPTRHLHRGDRVLDLGSGGGKMCFIAAQVVGPEGSVLGVDMNDDMLALAQRAAPVVAERLGYANVTFAKARIQDLRPVADDGSVDVVMSNCVLNLVRPEDKHRLFDEIHRVLASGGRAVISDIVSDRDVPEHLQADPELWSGCISGAFREDRFLQAFAAAGFGAVRVVARAKTPWRVVEGIAFRSVTVEARKGEAAAAPGCCPPACC